MERSFWRRSSMQKIEKVLKGLIVLIGGIWIAALWFVLEVAAFTKFIEFWTLVALEPQIHTNFGILNSPMTAFDNFLIRSSAIMGFFSIFIIPGYLLYKVYKFSIGDFHANDKSNQS
jgi:hypothetical protein